MTPISDARRVRRLFALLGLVCAVTASAEPRAEAKRHFKAGMALIADGQFDRGIDELLEAYRIKPHPNVLYNIARAQEAAGRTAEALDAYRRYLEADPPDAPRVREQLAHLEATVPKKAPEAPRELKPGPTPAVDGATLQRLSELTERLERAVAKAELAPQGAPEVLPAALPPAATAAVEPVDFARPYEETVAAASRRSESTLDAPNATTVITGEEIRRSGLTSIPDILRRVPGAEVMTMGVSSANLSFRGFNQRIANKVLVLIDGRPEYQDFLGVTLWPVIPIGVEEIDRIEVIRGPGSALYGANAMLGVVNIVTRAPGTGPRAEFTGLVGSGTQAQGSFVASGGDALKYRASVGYTQADKYSVDYAADRVDVRSNYAEPALGNRVARANLTSHYAWSRDVSVSLSGGISRLFTEVYGLGLLRNYGFDGVGGYAKADASLGPVKLRFFWNHTTADAGPQYEPIGARSLASRLDSNVFDGELLFQKEFELGGSHLLGVGLSGRLKRVKWTYLGALQHELHAAAFVQDEYRPVKELSLVASYRIDRHPLLDAGQPGYAQSPRVSAVFRPFEAHSFRASFATAFREPTFLESYMDIRVPVPGVDGASVATFGNQALKPERLLSFELGYRGEAGRQGLSWEAAAYWNVVSDLIVLSGVTPTSAGSSWDPGSSSFVLGSSRFVNDANAYTAKGLELGATWNALDGLDFRGSAALQQVTANQAVAVCGPCTQAPNLKLNLGFTWRTPVKLELSSDVSFVSATVWVEREPSSADPTQVVNLQNPLAAYAVVNARAAYRFFDDRLTVSVVGTQLGGAHQEHPFGNNISRRVFALISVTP
jgi:iron complex outermembrane receptor protein